MRIANLLLRNGADPNKAIENKVITAIECQQERRECIQNLLQSYYYTPLMYISDMDHMEPLARTLLKHGACVNTPAKENV